MPLWRPQSVQEEPEIVLINWSVRRTERGECHLVGMRVDTLTGRVSSAIASFDAHTRTAETSTGRMYRLQGEPGWNTDSADVWQSWCKMYRVASSRDVTADILATASKGSSAFVASARGINIRD
ncbi:hypothetical protein [Paraburkholderia humisilvae]|uniref:Uncharacterized protein n=1 Tax=Paraburkholderia humisilvae TaxID=627669 RepID=A0A6J5DHY3_9BURK|nr:hypothetical protein [Paraburkholderia humisilvae]CAB3752456.1 hypothetical protein LMG29542_01758 [Paraburkholderia humisilvae]